MSGLQPVSFRKGRAYAQRLSKPRVPGRHHPRYWTEEDIAIVAECFPKGGMAACLARLPHRSISGIYVQARKLGVPAPRRKEPRGRIDAPVDIDATLRAEWPLLTTRGSVSDLAMRLNLPRWWVSARARSLGLVNAHRKEPRWTEAENKLMRSIPLHDLDRCAEIFREHGYSRSPTAIGVRAKRLELSRRATRPTMSGTQAAKTLGMEGKTVTQWCVSGELPATRRSDLRLPQQGGSAWDIKPEDLRRYVIDNIERIDIRKVDKVAFVHLLVGSDMFRIDA